MRVCMLASSYPRYPGDGAGVIVAALAAMNDPNVNEVLLAFKVGFSDRFTKTKVFPRKGMALPNGEVYTDEKITENE